LSRWLAGLDPEHSARAVAFARRRDHEGGVRDGMVALAPHLRRSRAAILQLRGARFRALRSGVPLRRREQRVMLGLERSNCSRVHPHFHGASSPPHPSAVATARRENAWSRRNFVLIVSYGEEAISGCLVVRLASLPRGARIWPVQLKQFFLFQWVRKYARAAENGTSRRKGRSMPPRRSDRSRCRGTRSALCFSLRETKRQVGADGHVELRRSLAPETTKARSTMPLATRSPLRSIRMQAGDRSARSLGLDVNLTRNSVAASAADQLDAATVRIGLSKCGATRETPLSTREGGPTTFGDPWQHAK